jgi:hypothetical protein
MGTPGGQSVVGIVVVWGSTREVLGSDEDTDDDDGVVVVMGVDVGHACPPGFVVKIPPHENVRPSPMLHDHSPVAPQQAYLVSVVHVHTCSEWVIH